MKLIYISRLCFFLLMISLDVLGEQEHDRQFYIKRANVAGEYYAIFFLAKKYVASECPIKINKDWTNLALAKKNILSKFPTEYHLELTQTFNQMNSELETIWKDIESLIRKRRLEGASCKAIVDIGFWPLFDKAVNNWNAELSRNY